MLHPQIRALVEAAPDPPSSPDLAAARAAYLETSLELGGALEPVGEIRDVVIPSGDGVSLRAQAYWPQHGAPRAVLVWLHGGGWMLGDLETFERVCRALANACGAVCVSVEYRLAPEHPFPAARDDAVAVLDWAAGDPFSLGGLPVVVGGDSAGGNLATVAARHRPSVAALQVLVYPVCDGGMDTESYSAFSDPRTLSREDMAVCFDAYCRDRDHPDVSPLRASLDELRALPPAIVLTAEEDVLRDEAEAYAARLREARVEVEHHRMAGMIHGFIRWGGVVDTTREAFSLIGTFVREKTNGPH